MQVKTSESHPLRVDFTEGLDTPGRLGLTFAPGKKCASLYGGYWDRDLDADLAVLKQEYQVDTLVSLIEDHEFEALQIAPLPKKARELGIQVRRFPIEDVNVPVEGRRSEFRSLVAAIERELRAGRTVVVHCRGGLGRAGLTAACVLVELGLGAEDAISLVRAYRPGAIETRHQAEFVRQYRAEAAA